MTVNGQAPVAYAYDAASRLTQLVQAPLSPVAINYDASGRRTLLRLPNGVTTAYDYDFTSRLTRLTYTSPSTLLGDLTYQYDAAGNRTAVGGSFARTLLPDPVLSATYDAANQQLVFGSKTMTYDNNGNLATLTEAAATTSFTWDARNRLAALSGPTTGSFAYDVQGRRVRRDISGELREYQYDGVDVARERINGTDTSYLRTLGIDEAVCRIAPDGTEYYLADALSSTLALTDGAGGIGTTYTYDPFGRTVASGLASRNTFQFTRRENDGTELYYYRARYYNSGVKRFLSEDPMYSPLHRASKCLGSYSPRVSRYTEIDRNLVPLLMLRFYDVTSALVLNSQKLHLYSYADNDPTNKVDPEGLRAAPQSPGCDVVGDLPGKAGNFFNSPCAKQCCNVHDDCFTNAYSWCDMSTWLEFYFNIPFKRYDCMWCNIDVVRCLGQVAISGRKDCQ